MKGKILRKSFEFSWDFLRFFLKFAVKQRVLSADKQDVGIVLLPEKRNCPAIE